MNITITGKEIKATEAIKDYVEKKLTRIEKYFAEELINVTVTIKKENAQSEIAEMYVSVKGVSYKAVTEDKDLYAAIDKEKLQERLAKIAGGVAVIQVGAATETEMKDKKLRIEDALSATKAAIEEGIVAGGGTAYINIIPKVSEALANLSDDEKLGVKIVLKALEEPIKQIVTNAGLEPAVIIEKVKSSEQGI